jgi:glycosyltransferase involved in cell wall biosynthesis
MTRPQGIPRLTIAIPTVNRASLVARAIESAMAQTFPDIEILVSNNGSTDDTRTVLDRYDGAPRVRILHRDQTIPANEHGTLLVEQARGEFYICLSDDDWLEPDMAARVIERFDRNPRLRFVWTGCLMYYAEIAVPALVGPDVEPGHAFLAEFLAGRRNVCWCACVIRTADLRRLGPPPPQVICGDMFFWTKLAAEGDVGCVREPLSNYSCYRPTSDGMAGGTPVKRWIDDQAVWARDILAVCRASSPDRPYSDTLERDAAWFMARTVANQFALNALRGTGRLPLLRSVPLGLPFLKKGDSRNWIAVIASVVAPRWLLKNRVLAEAKRRAGARMAPGRAAGARKT